MDLRVHGGPFYSLISTPGETEIQPSGVWSMSTDSSSSNPHLEQIQMVWRSRDWHEDIRKERPKHLGQRIFCWGDLMILAIH